MYDINYDIDAEIDPDFKVICTQCSTIQPIDARRADDIARSTGMVRCVECGSGITISIRGVKPKFNQFDVMIGLDDYL